MHNLTRRMLITHSLALGTLAATPALAVSQSSARNLVDALVAEVNSVIASGASEAAMLTRFETLFARYADVDTIAGYVLGVERRRATPAQLQAWTRAYTTYVARKYGRRFREFIGGQIVVVTTRDLPRGVEVETSVNLRSQSPFRVDFHVEDNRGRPLFFNIIIEGINMLLSERTEILAQLDSRGGDINRLIAELRQN